MSAPPDSRTANHSNKMSGQNHQEPPSQHQSSNVRVIPIVVEGRDEPVINRSVDHGTHFGDSKPTHVPPQPQPHIDRDQYFADDGPIGYTQPPNFTRSFGAPFNKFRQGPQPFVQQKVYPQSAGAFARGASPQRSQSPHHPQPQQEEHYVKVPVHHEHAAPKAETPSRQQKQPPPQQPSPQQQAPPQQQVPPQQQAPPQQQVPPQPAKPQPSPNNDPISQILAIQTDVLNLMSEVENFKGTKKDKNYLFLDEMLTRNLIKLDNIETDGKENIRQARKEAIKCIQKCIAVLEAKADNRTLNTPQPQEVEMKENEQNGEVEMQEAKEEEKAESQTEPQAVSEEKKEEKKDEPKLEEGPQTTPAENKETPQEAAENKDVSPQAADTRPEENASDQTVEAKQENVEKKAGAKKGGKNVKKRDKSKDKQVTTKDSAKEETKVEKVESMQVDDKGDKPQSDSQGMEVDATPSQ